VVRNGADYRHPRGAHTMQTAYVEMLRQVTRDYNGIGDYKTLTLSDIRFLYDGLRAELQKATKE